jgi:FkbM family methyltransferase
MKKILGTAIAYLFSKILSILRTGKSQVWSRDEIRQMNFSFSQFGEDVVISNYLARYSVGEGIYLDVGAFNPITFSNTLLLYKQGWQGINIDIDIDKIADFVTHRPRDFSMSAAISDRKERVKFVTYPARATNRILPIDSQDDRSVLGEQPLKVTILETTCLNDVIAASPFADKNIYYLNIDCEGNDLKVLKNFDLERYLPKVISIEAWSEGELDEIKSYLLPKGYTLDSCVHLTKIFTRL